MSTSRSKLRQCGESHVLLEEIAYIFRLALLRMIDGNTNPKTYGIMRLTALIGLCNGLSASFSAWQNIIMRKTGFFSPPAQNFAVLLLLARYCKCEIRSSSSLASCAVLWMTVSTSSIDTRKVCVKFFSVTIWSTPRKEHDMISTRPLSDIGDPTQPMKLMRKRIPPRSSNTLRDLSGRAQDMLTATLYSCWSHVHIMMSCSACFVSLLYMYMICTISVATIITK